MTPVMCTPARKKRVQTTCARNRPRPIQRAIYLLGDRLGDCAEVNTRCRLLMLELVRFVSASEPAKPFHVRKETLALALGVTVRTICRWTGELEALGWINRHQDISRRKGAQVGATWLTPRALSALELKPEMDAGGPCIASDTHVRRLEGYQQFSMKEQLETSESNPKNNTKCEEQSASHEMTGISPTVQPMGDVGPGPIDLALLGELQIVDTAVWYLMRIARERKVRLGHVLAARETYIRQAHNTVAYIAKLICNGCDWAAEALKAGLPGSENDQVVAEKLVEQAIKDKQELLETMDADSMFSHDKHAFVWRVIGGHVHVASVSDAAQGAARGSIWNSVHDLCGLADARRAGKLFKVTQTEITSWPVPNVSSLSVDRTTGPNVSVRRSRGLAGALARLSELRCRVGRADTTAAQCV